MANKKLTKSDIISSNIMYIAFSIIGGIAALCMAIVTIFLIVCVGIGIIKSFTIESQLKLKALGLTLCIAISCSFFIIAEILLIKTMISGLKKYEELKKESLNNIE